jgi:hypothetical protein
MDAATFERETARNQQAFAALREQIRRNYVGRYVALGDGRILASAPTYDETLAAVQRLPSAPEYFLVFAAEDDPIFEPFCDYGTSA